jgi:hypothetical protein
MDAIARLRRIAQGAAGDDGAWLRDRLAIYERDVWFGVTIDDALGFVAPRGGEGWWRTEARKCRDRHLRAAAACLGLSGPEAADELAIVLARYETTRWIRDRTRDSMPPHYAGTLDEHLFKAFETGRGKVPLGRSQLCAILSHCNS